MYSLTAAVVLLVLVSFGYVGLLYLPQNRYHNGLGYEQVVSNRVWWVRAYSGVVVILVPVVLAMLGATRGVYQGVVLLGVIPWARYTAEAVKSRAVVDYLSDMSRSVLLVCGLFVGPLVARFGFERANVIDDVMEELGSIDGRKKLIHGPVTEEIVFRAGVIGLLIPAQSLGLDQLIFLAPLSFGVAHLHHGVELYREGHGLLKVVLLCAIQMSYTWLFGVLATFVFLRTGNLLGCILIHGFCNYMGLPELMPSFNRPWKLAVYWVLLVVGLVVFTQTLFPSTASSGGPVHWH